MMPPRPWTCGLAEGDAQEYDVFAADYSFVLTVDDRETAYHVTRLVNAEPEVIAALEAAEAVLAGYQETFDYFTSSDQLNMVRAALAKVRQ